MSIIAIATTAAGDTSGNVYFVSQGYTIGLGTRIAAVAGKLP